MLLLLFFPSKSLSVKSSKTKTRFFFNTQESAGCKMQMIQDGNFANAPEKPLRITGSTISVKVSSGDGFCVLFFSRDP